MQMHTHPHAQTSLPTSAFIAGLNVSIENNVRVSCFAGVAGCATAVPVSGMVVTSFRLEFRRLGIESVAFHHRTFLGGSVRLGGRVECVAGEQLRRGHGP
jgi:hypothetical protein